MSLKTVKVTADKVKNREKTIKRVKIAITIILIILILLFLVLSLVYKGGRFTVTLDPNFAIRSGIVIYDNLEEKRSQRKLYANGMDFMDNISIKWLPANIGEYAGGAHNGDNYIAYTFYVDNQGEETLNYWYYIYIDDVIKNVDDAVRVMVIHNDTTNVYGKINADTKEAEEGTIPFHSKEIAVLEPRQDFKPKEIDKFTVVIWLEGDDPDCVDAIIGGEIKMHMEITEEHLEQEG